jgi:hypothetical protein
MLSNRVKWWQNKGLVLCKGPLVVLVFFLYSVSATAQCAMCRASLESTGNKTKVEAVNDGIVFLMAIPYILAAVIGYVVYKMYAKKTKA